MISTDNSKTIAHNRQVKLEVTYSPQSLMIMTIIIIHHHHDHDVPSSRL